MPVVFTSALGLSQRAGRPRRRRFGEQVWGVSQTPQVWLDHQVIERRRRAARRTGTRSRSCSREGCSTPCSRPTAGCWSGWSRRRTGTTPAPALLPGAQRARPATGQRHGRRRAAAGCCTTASSTRRRERARTRPRCCGATTAGSTYGELRRPRAAGGRRPRRRGASARRSGRGDLPKGAGPGRRRPRRAAAGAAYVPVGVDQPAAAPRAHLRQRRRRVRCSLTTPARSATPGRPGRSTVSDAATAEPLPGRSGSPATQLAYVIYTSGSTGEPKGVDDRARGGAQHGRRHQRAVRRRPGRPGARASPRSTSTSRSTTSSACWRAGGAVVLIDEDARRDAAALGRAGPPSTASPSGTRCRRCWTCC